MALRLEDLNPEMGEFKLEATGEHVHRLRKVSLRDKVWAKKVFGKDIEEVFAISETRAKSPDFDVHQWYLDVIRIAYHQLEDKSLFVSKEQKTVDEEGKEGTIVVGGLELFEMVVVNPTEQVAITEAVKKTLFGSNVAPETVEKKTEVEAKAAS